MTREQRQALRGYLQNSRNGAGNSVLKPQTAYRIGKIQSALGLEVFQGSLLEQLQAYAPDKNVAFTAVRQLKTPQQMRQFLKEYITWLGGNPEVKDPQAVAIGNLSYILGYFDKKVGEPWKIELRQIE